VAFTDVELAYLRTRLGSTVNEDTNPEVIEDLEDRYARLGTTGLVVIEVLRQRLADIANAAENPLNYTIPGEYSQDASKNVEFLVKAISDAENEEGVHPVGSLLTAARAPRSRWRR
jgi:hypothetical protein